MGLQKHFSWLVGLIIAALSTACDSAAKSPGLVNTATDAVEAPAEATPATEEKKEQVVVLREVVSNSGLSAEEKELLNSVLDRLEQTPGATGGALGNAAPGGQPSASPNPALLLSPEQQAADLIASLSEFLGDGSGLSDPNQGIALLLSASARLAEKIGNDLSAFGTPAEDVLDSQKVVLSAAVKHFTSVGVPLPNLALSLAKELAKIPGATVSKVQSQMEIAEFASLTAGERSLALAEGVSALRDCVAEDLVIKGTSYFCPDGSLRTGTFDPNASSDIDPAVILLGESVKGVAGTYAPDFPSAANVRSSETTNGAVGTLADCTIDGQIDCVATSTFKATAVTGLASKVVAGQVVAGESGVVVLPQPDKVLVGTGFGAGSGISGVVTQPAAAVVKVGETFGPNLSLTGTYNPPPPGFPDLANVRSADATWPGSMPDCTSDGQSGCYVPASTALKAADTSQFTGWDIRRKRNPSTGQLLTFGGLGGQLKFCKERANLSRFDNGSATVGATTGLVDLADALDYWNNGNSLPGQLPRWLMINSNNYSADFQCGDIYATGDQTSGSTGADPVVSHNVNGNWQDLTPSIKPGGLASTNPVDGCNATDKVCVYRELISGLMVTEMNPNPNFSVGDVTWEQAWSRCDSLGVAPNPIPITGGQTYDDWRLPTHLEVMYLENHGLRGLVATANMRTNFGNVDADVGWWTLTTYSTDTTKAWARVLRDWNGKLFASYPLTKTSAAPSVSYLSTFNMRYFCVR